MGLSRIVVTVVFLLLESSLVPSATCESTKQAHVCLEGVNSSNQLVLEETNAVSLGEQITTTNGGQGLNFISRNLLANVVSTTDSLAGASQGSQSPDFFGRKLASEGAVQSAFSFKGRPVDQISSEFTFIPMRNRIYLSLIHI